MPRHFRSSFLDDIMQGGATSVEAAGTVSNVQEPAFEVPGGDGAPGPRERRRQLLEERRQLRVDTGAFERPQFDAEQSRLNRIITGVGAVGGLVAALGGSEIGAAAGAGLARGGARNLRRQRKSFRRRQQAFRERTRGARQFNRELSLSVNEAQLRGAEQQAERQAEQRQSEEQFQQEKELMQLRERLESKLSPNERKKIQKELDLLDKRIQARSALTTERQTQAEANRALAEERRSDAAGGGGDEEQTRFRHLSDAQITSLLERSKGILEKGFPPSVDTDNSGDLSTSELLSAKQAGVSLPSSADIDRVAERMSALRQEAARRGLIETEEGESEATTGSQEVQGPEVSDREVQRALQMVNEGVITAEQFKATYGMSVSEARQ